MPFKKTKRINCVRMVKKVRALGFVTQSALAKSSDPKEVDRFMARWCAWLLSHDMSMWWEMWQEAHEDYVDHLEEIRQRNDEKRKKPEEIRGVG